MIDIPDPRTVIYSTLDNSQLKLDYFLPSNATGSLPAIVCFHGGGMTVGDRRMGPGMPIWLFGSFKLSYLPNPKFIGSPQSWQRQMG
jgi:hypothetical protein